MGATAAVHPADPILQAYGLGKLDDVSSASVNKHLEGCDSCQRRVAELSSDDFLGRLQKAKVMSDKTSAGWSSSAPSSTDGGARPADPPLPVETLPPELVDHPDYEIVRELGRGGMGVVYLARNKLMCRLEVLKVVGRHLVERPGVFDRFLREVRSAAKLQHANIVTAYSAMRLGSSVVLTMEYVEGLDLAKMVKTKGPLPVAHACYFIHQAALGLQHAHERGMVHRDIKPANLILAREGKKAIVKVLDFGLAKVTSEGESDSGLTREGQMLGTPDYIAPEQIRDAQSADTRADVYSLGCTFYYLLTGGPPFRGDHLWDLYQAHFSMEAQPLNLIRPEVPVELNAVVAKMMAKEPGRRFQTPGDVAQALTPFVKKSSESERSSTAEKSVLGQRELKLGASGPGSLSTQPGTNAIPVPTAPAENRTETTTQRIDKMAGSAAVVAAPEQRRPRWLWPVLAAAVLLLGSAVTWGVIVRIKTSNGMIELVDLPTDAKVFVDGERVTVDWRGGRTRPKITVAAGPHEITVKKDGLTATGEELTVQPGDRRVFTVRFLATPDASREFPKERVAAEPVATASKDLRPSPLPATKSVSSLPPMPPSLTSSIGLALKLIPAGEFKMGSRDDDAEAEKDEKPVHPVKISAFYMGIHEVTQAQYYAVMGINPSYFSATGGGKYQLAGRPTDQYPVEYVTWLDAVRFCNALSERDGFPPFYEINGENVENVEIPNRKGAGYRLPSEAEWEYACRARTDTKYWFGNDTALLSDYAWFGQNSVGMSHPVGEKGPNAFGLYDMHGNIFERCFDLYDDTYYKQSPADDPLKSSGTGARLIRGGSWLREPRWSRSSVRYGCAPMGRYWDNGFRVVLNPSEHIGDLERNIRTIPPSKLSTSSSVPEPATKPTIDMMSESTRMAFALIKPGDFMMGSPEDDVAASQWEKPPRKVRITAPFYLGIYEVTQAQYQAVLGNNPSHFSSTGGGKDVVGRESTAQYPVEYVSWLDAIRFCNALSKKDGILPYYRLKGDKLESLNIKGTGYRLPTEAEWEYACRAATSTRFYCGNDPSMLGKHGWIGGSAGGITHPVGQKLPNGFGLFDTHGNVWEWCFDWADGAYYKLSPTNDPPGAAKGTHRVIRGGSWRDEPPNCRSANLQWCDPAGQRENIGFRVARGLTAEELARSRQAQSATSQTDSATPAVSALDELIKNPGCEELGADAKIAFWTEKAGTWTRGSKDQPPFEGSFFFSPGNVPEAELRQDIDVGRLAESIDTKTQSFAFSAQVRSWNQVPADTCRVVVEFLGSDRSAPLDQTDSGPVVSIDRWKPVVCVRVAPAHTRWIRIRLISHRQNGDANDGIYDGLSLKAVKKAPDTGTKTTASVPSNKPAAAAPAPIAKGSPEEQLKSRGLIRSGSYFVVASEAEALDKFQEFSPLIKQLDQAARSYARVLELEYRLAGAEDDLKVAHADVEEANTVLSKMPNGARTNSADKQQYEMQQSICANLTMQRDVISRGVEELRAQQPRAGLKNELASRYMARWAEFLKLAPPVLQSLERAKEEHRKLQGETAVRKALATIRLSTKAEVSLSPAKRLQAPIDIIKGARRDYSPETNAPKKKPKAAKR